MFDRRTALAAVFALTLSGLPAARAAVPEILLPAAEIAGAITQAKPQPLRYAVEQVLDLDLRNGSWDEPEAGTARWRLQLRSPGASNLAAQLNDLRLPQGATLWLIGAGGSERQGPLQPDSEGVLWTPMVRGDTATLELRVPAAQRDDVSLRLHSAQHGYRDPFDDSGVVAKAEGDSGSCNINVACSEGSGWSREIRATVMLTINNSVACSGTLVNNVRQDNRPLVLTANHCGLRTDANARASRAYFEVQKSSCSSTVAASRTQNIAGSTFLARDSESDFTLFTLASTPPSSYDAYYSGWNAGSAIPQSGVTIHHPQADDKKISVYSSPAQRAENVRIGTFGGFSVDAWQVTWSRGTTEGGSSGAGLWNQNRQLVGILSGGSASCASTGDPDYFARFERAWLANSATTGQLKAHLDPDNAGCLAIAGKEPGAAASNACTGGGSGGDDDDDGGALGSGGALTPALLLLLAAATGLRRRSRLPT